LRLDMDRGPAAPEFAPFDIDLVITKAQSHSWAEGIWDGAAGAPAACTEINIATSSGRWRERTKSRVSQEPLRSIWRLNHSILKALIGHNVHVGGSPR
jgi:hypothetical protein